MVAAFLVYNYVSGVEDTAAGNAKEVQVYMVKAPVARGTGASEASAVLVKENVPQKFKPANAIENLEDIAGKVAITDLPANQIVVADMWTEASDPAARASFSKRLKTINDQDQVAVTISLDSTRSVAGLVEPGDYVNIMVTEVTNVGSETSTPPDASQGERLFAQQARTLYQKVRVLAVGKNALPTAGQSESETAQSAGDSGLITFIVPSKAASYIASVPASQIYLTLVPDDYTPTEATPINLNDKLPGENKDELTPYGKAGDR